MEPEQFSRPKSFKFYNSWIHHSSFLDVVLKAWHAPIIGSPMFTVARRLKSVKEALKRFNSTVFQPSLKADLNLENEVREIQSRLLSNSADPADSYREVNLSHKLLKAKLIEEENAQ